MAMQNQIGYAPSPQGGILPVSYQQSNFDPNQQAGAQTLQAPQLQSAKDIAGIQAGAGIQQAQIGADASKYPATLAMQRFNEVFPFIKGQLGGLSGTLGGALAGGGGASGMGPNIKVGGVWNPQQIQQQVNATRAQNDQSMHSQMNQNAAKVSGEGYGSNSPLLMALQGQSQGQNLATNTQAEQTLRTTAAGQNQQALLASQQARANQYNQQQQAALTARGQTLGTYNALLSSLSGLA